MNEPAPPLLVISDGNSLLPFAWRLRKEGLEVEVGIAHARKGFSHAWEGNFKSVLPVEKGAPTPEVQRAVVEQIQESEAGVITNSGLWTKLLGEAGHPQVWGCVPTSKDQLPSPLAVGAWFDGEGFSGHHYLFRDVGLWPGGLGAAVVSGATLVPQTAPHQSLVEVLLGVGDSLKAASFRGLVGLDVVISTGDGDEEGPATLQFTGRADVGWPAFHTHAFVSELPSLWRVLAGHLPLHPLPFTQVVGVSVPPWPLRVNLSPPEVPIGGPLGQGGRLSPQQLGSIFFHDMKVEKGEAKVAGTNGLVGVVRGAGLSLETARRRALTIAEAIQLPEKQYRQDAGATAAQGLQVLEELGLLT